ncbi:MAG: endonuclease [Crocinitomicaceae bacterium]|nr:endonuclease [Crocinitomicaceae bacterium]
MAYLWRMKILLAALLVFIGANSYSQIPTGYYDSALGFTGDLLKDKLHLIIDNHTEFPYTSSGTDVWDILKETDKDTSNPNNVLLLYSGWSVDANQEFNGGTGWNREHVWAKSRGDFGTASGPGTDVHALRPCDITVNAARGNRWFAECSTEYIDGDGTTGSYMSFSSWVWKPNDQVKGDVARMIFYMATRYEGTNGEPDLEVIDSIPSDDFTNAPIHAKFSDLYQWHLEDPVDDWERNRNDIIHYQFQNNRNPYIDHPEYVYEVWGAAIILDIDEIEEMDSSLSIYPNPTSDNLTVTWNDKSGYTITIRDMLGRLISTNNTLTGESQIVDVSELESGNYLIEVSSDNQRTTKTFSIEKKGFCNLTVHA